MSNKYSSPTGLRPPALCHKAPPWPVPTRLPRGLLSLTYRYELVDDEAKTIVNVGRLTLTQNGENYWEYQPPDPIWGKTNVGFWYNPETDLFSIDFNVLFSTTIAAYWLDDAIPASTRPPFHLVFYPGLIEDPHWLIAQCSIEMTAL